jgi:hypothetical protein
MVGCNQRQAGLTAEEDGITIRATGTIRTTLPVFCTFMNDVATLMSDTSPRYGQNHGWYASFVRVNTDAVGGWTSESGLIDTSQFDGWINNFLVPYAEHLNSRGLYLLFSATGPMVVNVDGDGARNASQGTQSRLLTFWERVANAPGVKNADNIMFELMNEPVQIESSPGNGDWSFGSATYFEAFNEWLQPIINSIRNTGANNVIWVPTLEWQGSPHQWDQFPFSGSNIGVACHYYPAYGGVFDNVTAIQDLWDRQYKPAADRWPMIITEMFWTPYPNDPWNLVNGSTAGFGNAIRNAIGNQGNVSYLVGFIGDLLESLNDNLPDDCYLSSREGAQSYFLWLPEYTWIAPDDGTPEYEYASVTDNNPKQILVIISKPVKKVNNFEGFTIKIDSQVVEIDSVVLVDSTNQLVINLSDSILNDNEIVFSYINGNVVSIYEKNLVNFNDTLVDNLLKGASPRITELKTNEDGDTLIAEFNMKMQVPSDLSALTLDAQYNGHMSIPILQSSFFDNDSTLLLFSLEEQVYADYRLLLSYSGNNIISSDGGLLKTFSDFPATNNSQGLPVQIDSGRIESDGISVILEFSKPLAIAIGQSATFTLKVNRKSVSFKEFFTLKNTISFTLLNNVHYDDTVTVSYTPGNIIANDQGILEGFSDFQLANLINIPEWISIPNKIEAENYNLQSGIQTEQTGDIGGGLNVGWIDDGDWLEYAIENNTSDTLYEITFRISSPNNGSSLDFYLDNKKIGQVSVPNTGGWQTWQSVVDDLNIGQGKHYLKVVAISGGFNINYYDIKNIETEIRMLNNDDIKVYPNPVSSEMIIRSADFRFNEVEIIDIIGNKVLRRLTAYESELHMPVNLSNGIYIVKISNEKQFQLKKIL